MSVKHHDLKPVNYAPHLNMFLPVMEPYSNEIIFSSVPAVSAACGFGVGRRRGPSCRIVRNSLSWESGLSRDRERVQRQHQSTNGVGGKTRRPRDGVVKDGGREAVNRM